MLESTKGSLRDVRGGTRQRNSISSAFLLDSSHALLLCSSPRQSPHFLISFSPHLLYNAPPLLVSSSPALVLSPPLLLPSCFCLDKAFDIVQYQTAILKSDGSDGELLVTEEDIWGVEANLGSTIGKTSIQDQGRDVHFAPKQWFHITPHCS